MKGRERERERERESKAMRASMCASPAVIELKTSHFSPPSTCAAANLKNLRAFCALLQILFAPHTHTHTHTHIYIHVVQLSTAQRNTHSLSLSFISLTYLHILAHTCTHTHTHTHQSLHRTCCTFSCERSSPNTNTFGAERQAWTTSPTGSAQEMARITRMRNNTAAQ
jgi:hypothetical protein